MGSIGWLEIVLIALVLVLLFGARKIPEVARGLGQGIRTFRKELHGESEKPKQENQPTKTDESGPATM